MPAPAQLLKRINIAYLCFLIPGVCVILATIAPFFPTGIMEPAYFGFFVLIPLALVSAVTISVAVILTFTAGRREPALIVLSVASLILVVEGFSGFGGDLVFNAIHVLYGLLVVVLEANWFLFRRKNVSGESHTAA